MLQNEGVKIRTEGLSPAAGCCEHGNEHLGSIIWRNFLTIWVIMSCLMKSGTKFHFTFLHTCRIQRKVLSAALYDVFVCNIYMYIFRELSTLLITGPAGFGPARGAILMEMVMVAVPLVTAVTNWSAMGPEVYLRSPWLR